jgi:hypothetical protein
MILFERHYNNVNIIQVLRISYLNFSAALCASSVVLCATLLLHRVP